MSYSVEDCVHAELSLPSYAIEIINTKEFQRLKNLKQLGKPKLHSDLTEINCESFPVLRRVELCLQVSQPLES